MSLASSESHSVLAYQLSSQPIARLREAIIEGWIASRWDSKPGRPRAIRDWVDQRLARRLRPTLLAAAWGSSACEVLAASYRVGHVIPRAAYHKGSSEPSDASRSSSRLALLAADHDDSTISDRTISSRFSTRSRPGVDLATLSAAHQIAVLWLRRSSQTAEYLEKSLCRNPQHPIILLPDDERLVPEYWRDRLESRGARIISVAPHREPPEAIDRALFATAFEPHRSDERLALSPRPPWLIHTTRASDRRRSGETHFDFLHRLLSMKPEQIGGPLVTLRTILQESMLRGRSEPIRGAVRVVSWSAAPLKDLLARRTFRPARRHWDYEPYGIAIPQHRLLELGAAPVTYAPASDFTKIPPSERPFFQPLSSRQRHADEPSSIDWSQEQEWRTIGDLRLSGTLAKESLVFVPSQREAMFLQSFTTIRVVALESAVGRKSLGFEP